MTPEGKVKKRLKGIASKYGAHEDWPVQTGYGTQMLDVTLSLNGFVLYVECKVLGGKLTPRQRETAKKIRAAGNPVLLYDTSPQSERTLISWLELAKTRMWHGIR